MQRELSYPELKEKLKAAGLKTTPQRAVILEALYSLNHPSAENIFDFALNKFPGISLGTIYKTLDTLVAAGMATKVPSDAGSFRYDFNTQNHNHIFCTNTDEILDYEDSELRQIIEEYFKKKKFDNLLIKDIRLHINAEKIDPGKDL